MQEKQPEIILILVGSTVTIVILISLVVIALFVSQRRRFQHQQQLVELKNVYEREVLKTQLETQSQTFAMISQELHDNVGTLISMGIVHLKSLPEVLGEAADKNISEANKTLDEAMGILRDLSRSINPEYIQKLGLSQSIRNELDRFKRAKMFTTKFNNVGEDFPIDPQKQMIIFRIFQEALNNVIKHANATEIFVSLKFDKPLIELSVQDNGRGFVYLSDQGGYVNQSGIANMTKRAKLINAVLAVKSEIGKGTRIELYYHSS
jgi:two-component system, NarL family, sensor kinase